MSKQTKKILSLFAATVMCFSAVSATAAEWKLTGYETSDAGISPFYQEAALIYQEFDENGFATGRQVSGESAWAEGLVGFGKIEFKNPWVDRTFPNKEYAKMYVNGQYSGRVFETGREYKDVVEYRDANFMWEAAAPYKIYSRKQANLSMGWYTDLSYPISYNGENALVKSSRPYYGFADYDVAANGSVTLIPEALKAYRDAKYQDMVGLTVEQINPKTKYEFNPIEITGEVKIPRTFDFALEGPTFNFDGSVNDAFGMKLLASTTAPEKYDIYSVRNLITTLNDREGKVNYADITWTNGGYEIAPPHRCYQFLTVDGVVMDGSAIPGAFDPVTLEQLYKPYIFRYVGNANPIITWKPAYVAQSGEVVLRRFVDGIKDTNDASGLKLSGIFTNPEYFEVIDTKAATKSLEACYRFMYDGKEYVLDSNGNTLVVDWSTRVATKVFVDSTVLAPYIAE